jgi:hypothetical protein
MIPLIAGIAAVTPMTKLIGTLFNPQPTPTSPLQFQAAMTPPEAISPKNATLNNLLKGRSPAELSPAEQQQLGTLLVGSNISITDTAGRTLTGTVGQISQVGNQTQLNVAGTPVSLSALQQIQILS